MASESFDVTDANGVRVTGTIEVYRDRNGEYYNPNSPFYHNPRFAQANFEYLNTREACTIDPDVLSEAMQAALANALEKFGIPRPDSGKVGRDVNASIAATRLQCARNADKYVSNETSSSTNWDTGKSVGNVTAKAYVAVPAPGGSTRAMTARVNSWPADDIPALGNNGSPAAPILNGRVFARGSGRNDIGNKDSSPVALSGDTSSPSPLEPPNFQSPAASTANKTLPYPSRGIVEQRPAPPFDTAAPAGAARQSSFDDRFGNWPVSPASIAPRVPSLPVPAPEPSTPRSYFASLPIPPAPMPIRPDHPVALGMSQGNWPAIPFSADPWSGSWGTTPSSPTREPWSTQGSAYSMLGGGTDAAVALPDGSRAVGLLD